MLSIYVARHPFYFGKRQNAAGLHVKLETVAIKVEETVVDLIFPKILPEANELGTTRHLKALLANSMVPT